MKHKIAVILASSSPRRIELMKQVGIRAEIMPPLTDEKIIRGEAPKNMVLRLAQEKGIAVLEKAMKKHRRGIVISADTTVVSPDGKSILGKPTHSQDAIRMLKLLNGKVHTVYTGYCILSFDQTDKIYAPEIKKHCRAVLSKVKMRELKLSAIQNYVATGEPMDKAGSYGVQGMGTALVENIRGSYTNVVGLPMSQLVKDLEDHFGFEVFINSGRVN